jgi:hypothetical protein
MTIRVTSKTVTSTSQYLKAACRSVTVLTQCQGQRVNVPSVFADNIAKSGQQVTCCSPAAKWHCMQYHGCMQQATMLVADAGTPVVSNIHWLAYAA